MVTCIYDKINIHAEAIACGLRQINTLSDRGRYLQRGQALVK